MFRSPSLFVVGLLALIIINPAWAVDLFTCQDGGGHVLVFTVPDTEPVSATVDQAGATQAAITWARHFYRLNDLDILAVEFKIRPVRFWRITFLAWKGGHRVPLCAAVLPDGRPVEPIGREET